MKTMLTTLALASALVVPAWAQQGSATKGTKVPPALSPTPPSSNARPKRAASPDTRVFRTKQEIPKSEIVETEPSVVVPAAPVDSYLLQKEHGPFMVMAKTFRGPDASQYAAALARELRESFRLPAYVFHLKIKPGNSNVRGVQPTAEPFHRNGDLAAPERFRTYDEAAVLVGNCKTADQAETLLKEVKKMRPKCLDAMPAFGHRKDAGLKYAYMTANPLQAAQNLYPGREVAHEVDTYSLIEKLTKRGKRDPFVEKMNAGPRSVYQCPGPYTIQVAEFSGQSTADDGDTFFKSLDVLKRSPLMTAHEDAERLAELLSKKPALASLKPFVYHDRTSSRVMLGAFRSLKKEEIEGLRQAIDKTSVELIRDKKLQLSLTCVPVLLGTPEGSRIRDSMIQRTSVTRVPDLIPIPTR